MNLNNFYDAWWFLYLHPMNEKKPGENYHLENLDVYVAKVNPKTKSVSKNKNKNTKTAVWLEFGPYEFIGSEFGFEDPETWISTHDPRLDCGGKTYEKAIIKLAKLVQKHYGDY